MQKEYEKIPHAQFHYLNSFIVRLISRTSHVHREIEIGFILEGQATLRIGTEVHYLKAQDIYYINPMETHEFLSADEGILILAFQISIYRLADILPSIQTERYCGSPSLREAFKDRPDEYHRLQKYCYDLAFSYMAREERYEYTCLQNFSSLMLYLHTELPYETLARDVFLSGQLQTDRILAITGYIDKNFHRKLLLSEIAEREDLSLTYLSHFFKDTLGVSFQEYLKQKRFEYACMLITSTNHSLLDISMMSGFSDSRYLSKLFVEKYGCSPKEYRSSGRELLVVRSYPTESNQMILPDNESYHYLVKEKGRLLSGL